MAKGTRATAALDKAGIAHGLHAYDYSAEVDSKGLAAAQALGIDPAWMFKTLMAWVDKQPVIAVIPSNQRLSLKKLAAACAGKHAQMMEIAEAERRSGYKVGGISPFAQQRPAAVLFAGAAQEHGRIWINAGQRGLLLDIAPADALRFLQARCADVCE
ncbi:MAG: aminoacyl-tRNA deacylase [Stenotrophomonas nitritireducens]|uniref:aminoacyl-tRNA deacylase n=1 Tax=Stenotrophomonas TaxID=40323 RepID=UPI001AD3BA08|nr:MULTISPECIES: aminoacyl-tRNA deacylase [Stenotrophomonas]MBN8793637.1 aminoacyl-tRNA deacylase [Stenotrophomonas nitritireducens]MBN8797355.1 aminoacyl-tRNA deacylase [Stenotrophomonas nitritireducens]